MRLHRATNTEMDFLALAAEIESAAGANPAPLGSAHELFDMLLPLAASTYKKGNYAIAAALVIRSGGTETVCLGANTLFSDADPTAHAEMAALRLGAAVMRGDDVSSSDMVIVREAPDDRTHLTLLCSLEPCPMCTVAIINAGLDLAVVAHEDPHAGALLRPQYLPPLWHTLMEEQALRVSRCTTDDDPVTGVPLRLLDALQIGFLEFKDVLDQRLGRGGLLQQGIWDPTKRRT